MRDEELETLAKRKKIGMVPPDLVEAGRLPFRPDSNFPKVNLP